MRFSGPTLPILTAVAAIALPLRAEAQPDANEVAEARAAESLPAPTPAPAPKAAGPGLRLTTPAELQQWGEETLAAIHRDFWLADRSLYAERVGQDRRGRPLRREPAFAWGAGVQLSALAAAADSNAAAYRAPLNEYVAALETYWQEHDGIGGYDVLPGPKPSDRYYDDNAWLALALVEAFEATGEKSNLDRAGETYRFVVSGEDARLGGGLYWRENDRSTKNTCTNAPAIVAALRLYHHTRQPADRGAAERVYAWTCDRLQDDQDGLFWDNIALDGRVDRRKYSYNSGLMIRANCLLFELTGDEQYRAAARRIAEAAEARWIDADTGGVRDAGRFAHLLLEGLLELERIEADGRWLQTVERSVLFVRRELRGEEDRYPVAWGGSPEEPPRSFALLDQASAARAYLTLARAARARDE